ncbi:MAG TPA: protein kinase [Polyangiaceae bacterium]|jgi:serine/threonine-protein kinase
MPSDTSNAHDALHDAPDSKKEPESGSAGNDLQSGKTPQARILGDEQEDQDERGRAVLAQLAVGTVVDGKYRVDSVLGRGAMGVVVQATHLHLGERVALKFLRYKAKAGVGDDFAFRFKREARVSAKLKNEHITRVIDVGVWRDHVPYMVMDYLQGTDLRQVIKGSGPLPVPLAIDYTVQVCEGIAEAHALGIVHRDLKPSNLFITKRPDGSDIIKILDFGISKWSHDEAELEELTQTGVVLGSPKYMAPEQLFGSAEVDARADVWSVGGILYEMLCGRPPYDLPTFTKICAELSTDRMPPSLTARQPEIPAALDAIVMKCFQRTPANRIQNVAELAGGILDAVGAPFADAVRTRIAATLEPKSARDALAASGGSTMASGSYSAMLSSSTTGRKVVAFPPPPEGATGVEGTTSPTSVSPSSSPPKKSRTGLWLVPVAVVVLGGVAFLAFGGKGTDSPTTRPAAESTATPAATAAPTTGSPTTVAATASTATELPSSTATTAAPATTTTQAGGRPNSGPAFNASPATTVHAPWRAYAPRYGGPGTPPPTQTGAAPPPTTAQPVATTPPVATAKPDPLGDRQ